MQQAAEWKTALARGRQVRYKVTRQDRGNGLKAGEYVSVRSIPIGDIAAGDTILCEVGKSIRLRQVSRVLSLYGVPAIEIFIGDKSVVSRFVQESACFGKVFPLEDKPALPWWQSLLQRMQPEPEVVMD